MIEWTPIPGYAGIYWISPEGVIKNAKGLWMKPIVTQDGTFIELRKNGLRERYTIAHLIERTYGEEKA